MNDLNDQLVARIHRLATGQLEGALSADEQQELRQLLASDAAARRAYVEHMQDTVSLRWIFSGHCDRRLALPAARAWVRGLKTRVSGVAGKRVLAAAAAALVVLGYSVVSHLRNEPAGDAGSNASAAAAPRAINSAPGGVAAGVATLTATTDVRWDGLIHVPTLLSRIEVGQQLGLAAGTIELTFDSGAQVKVFGPAKIEISSPRSILCSLGRVKTLVGKTGKGFTIDTPKAHIVDLGTEFGVDISEQGETQVVVFQGSVDLSHNGDRVATGVARDGGNWTRRMQQGDALVLDDTGLAQRLVAVQRGAFFPSALEDALGRRAQPPVITGVRDNIRSDQSAKCYQIVHNGLREDALCFVDRAHQWNGLTDAGMPEFLIGADYIMPFNDDKFIKNLRVEVDIARPATCYIFLDDNMTPPRWLRESFKDTGLDIGLDGAKTIWHENHSLGEGPGRSVDFVFSIWSRNIDSPGTIVLGGVDPPATRRSDGFNMYGIAVVPKTVRHEVEAATSATR